MTGGDVLTAAHAYVKRGWPVIPLYHYADGKGCSCGTPGCKSPGKHPLWTDWTNRGLTSGPDVQATFGEDHPNANIGIVTGHGLLVADLDLWKNPNARVDLEAAIGEPLPATYEVVTGKGGVHLYYVYDATEELPSHNPVTGVELQADGGRQVVAPPSRSGFGLYAVVDDREPMPAPDGLLKLLRDRPRASAADVVEGESLNGANIPGDLVQRLTVQYPEHYRSEPFHKLVGDARLAKLTQGQTVTLLAPWANLPAHRDKYAPRLAELVALSWAKVDPPLTTLTGPPPQAPGDVAVTLPTGLQTRVLSRGKLADLPAPSPLIEGTLDLGTVAILAGYWGTLKSFIAQHMAASVASEVPWLARPAVRRKVLFLAPEGAHGLHDRWSAWEYTWNRGKPIDDEWLYTLPEAVQLADERQVIELCAAVAGEGYGLVVIDTLSKCMVGLEENAAKDMSRVVHSLYRVQAATGGGTVLATHHTGKDRTTVRGSSALEAGVDTVYQTEGDARMVKLIRTKRRDGPVEDALTCGFIPVEHTKTGVIVKTSTDLGLKGSSAELFSIYTSTFGGTGCSRAELRRVANMADGTFYRAVNALVKDGLLVQSGPDTRPFLKEPE